MKQHTITTYSFSELSDKSKEKAREWYRKDLEFFDDSIDDDARTIAKMLGIEIDKIYYSGFCSQGDGACFSGSFDAQKVQVGKVKEHAPKDDELIKIAEQFEKFAKEFPSFTYTVVHSGHYSHEKSTTFSFPDDENIEGEDDIISISRSFMKWIYRQLEKDWDYQNSNESVDENIQANDYQFTKEGNRSVTL